MRSLNLGAPAPAPKPTPPRPRIERRPQETTADPELLLISCIVSDPDYLLFPRARHLPVQAFTIRECQGIWACLLEGMRLPEDIFLLSKKSSTPIDRIFEIGKLAGIGVGFPEFMAEVEAKYRMREIRRMGAMMATTEVDDPAEWVRQLERISRAGQALATAEAFGAFDIAPDGDPSILLGDSYLCRGDGLVLSSTSSTGKSSMSLQMATSFALGRDFHGLKSNGRMKSLIFQAEDSRGDVGKVRRSIYHAMKLTETEQAQVNEHVLLVSRKGLRGQVFLDELRRLVTKHRPDLVWINPLQAFFDGDLTNAQDLGNFLRRDLDGLNEPGAFGYVIVHHTPKPPKGRDKVDLSWNEVMYDMAGGAEIINWARAIMSLRAAEERGQFNLILAKRGTEADVTREVQQGAGVRDEIVTTIPLKWCDELLEVEGRRKRLKVQFWEPRAGDPPREKAGGRGRPRSHEFSTYRSAFQVPADKAERTNSIYRRCQELGALGKSAFFLMLDAAVESGEVIKIAPQGVAAKYHLARA